MIWEAKESYSIPFVSILIILACYGMDKVEFSFDKVSLKNSKKVIVPIFIMLEIITLLFGILYLGVFSKTNYKWEDVSLHCYDTMYTGYAGIGDSKIKIKQNFTVEKPFEYIEFRCNPINQRSGNSIFILKENGKILSKKRLSSKGLLGDRLIVNVGKHNIKEKHKYTIEIMNNNNSSLSFATNGYKMVNKYDGKYTLNNIKENKNLFIRVYNIYEGPYVRTFVYWGMIVVIMIMELLSCCLINYTKKKK